MPFVLKRVKNFLAFTPLLMAQYPHTKPISGLAGPQMGLGEQTQAPATHGDPIRAPKQEIRPKQHCISYPEFLGDTGCSRHPSYLQPTISFVNASLEKSPVGFKISNEIVLLLLLEPEFRVKNTFGRISCCLGALMGSPWVVGV